jgi:hypothetical protein
MVTGDKVAGAASAEVNIARNDTNLATASSCVNQSLTV